ncbi:uncharacterized protein [Amphiura filiformis]|uniref:uncharacterized protein n=1 Tax=Amphiura filiformis TaxID=82378 RepID=UPI003B20FE9F
MKNYGHNFLLVYLDGFLYAIGGLDKNDKCLNTVERYDMKEMYWQRRAALPEGYQWVSAVPYQGMILAYGVKGSAHVITMYNPETNVWHTKLKETHTQGARYGYSDYDKDPVLFLHKGVCYRVVFQALTGDSAKNIDFWKLQTLRQPFVNKLEVQTLATVFCNCPNHRKKTAIKVSIGEEVKQDLIPPSEVGAFRIEDEVFVSFQEFVHQTDVTILEGQSSDVVLGKWENFHIKGSRNENHKYMMALTAHTTVPAEAALDYTNQLACALNDLRKQNQLCDIIINVGGRVFSAHKAVLAVSSSYFLAMFTSGFSEGTANEVNIDGKPEIFEVLLEHVYTGKLTMSILTAYEILAMASYMQFTDALKICKEYICTQLNKWITKSDKIRFPIGDIYQISQLPGCQGEFLAKQCQLLMCRHFEELKTSDVFLEAASGEFLKHFLELQDLADEDNEKEVLELVVKWLKFDWDSRCTHAVSLLGSVRLGLIPEEDLQELLDDDMRSIEECDQMLKEMQEGKQLGHSKFKLAREMPQHFATRSTITAPIVVSAAGYPGTTLTEFHYFDKRNKRWYSLDKLSCMDFEYLPSMIVVNGNLYAVGGFQQTYTDNYHYDEDFQNLGLWEDQNEYQCCRECLDDFFLYNDEQGTWTSLPCMKNARCEVQLVHLDGFIYALGGLDENGDPISYVERFDLAKEEWQELASLPRSFHCVSAIEYHGNIITYCKQHVDLSGKNDECIISVYYPGHDTWQTKLTENCVRPESCKLGPRLFQYEDQWYRVRYEEPDDENDVQPSWRSKLHRPVVNKVRVEGGDITVIMGEEVSQDLIPLNSVGAFRIEDDVFVNSNGFIIKTDTIDNNQGASVDLPKSEQTITLKKSSGITNLNFDKKKLLYRDRSMEGLYDRYMYSQHGQSKTCTNCGHTRAKTGQ